MRSICLTVVALLQFAVAQQDTTASTTVTSDGVSTASASTITDSAAASTGSATSTTSEPITRTIAVGLGGHVFSPSVVQASEGNFVEFQFYPTNHSVIRAEYKFPCIPYEMTGVDKVGFDSGFRVTDAVLANPSTFTIRINDSDPIFFYCGAPGSCIDWQMVGLINPNSSVSIDVQKEFAANSSFMLVPGEDWPDESETPFTTTTSGTSSPTGSSTSTGTASGSSSGADTENHGHGLSTGAIAGIAIGAAAVAIAGAALLFFCGRKSRRNNAAAPAQQPMAPAPPAYVPPGGYDYRSSMQPSVMSPQMNNKHMSAISAVPQPITDAFGNPTGQFQQYPAPYPQQQQQGYPPHAMNTPQQPYGWPGSPAQDIFGQTPTPNAYEQQPLVAGAELNSQRASSPGSMHTAPQPQSGGIEGFLQRQQRMSPPPENELHSQQAVPLMSHQRHTSASGPFEMSAK